MRSAAGITTWILFCFLFFAVSLRTDAQSAAVAPVNYIFDADSLRGFDEASAQQGAFNINAYGEEFKMYMYFAKRNYINRKYTIGIHPSPGSSSRTAEYKTKAKGYPANPNIAIAACQNEDFEDAGLTTAVPGTFVVAATNSVPGWTCTGGTIVGFNNCTFSGGLGAPNPIDVIAPGAAGLTDSVIGFGSSYKIYSVFGNTTTTYPAAAAQDPFDHYGDWFIRLNSIPAGCSLNRIEKTINVTTSNALFQYAYITVFNGIHCCCDNPSFTLRVFPLTACSTAGSPTSCPQFSTSAPPGAGFCSVPTPSCASVGSSPVTYYTSMWGPPNAPWKYTKWQRGTLDLTSFIGQCIKIQVTAFDCVYGQHTGYAYFDSQCSPLDIIGNGTSFPANTPSITLPTCGVVSTATITAPTVVGGYTWSCPGPYTIAPGSNGQTIYTGITGVHSLTMNPPGSCSPIIRAINVIVAPPPNLALPSNTMYTCSNPTFNAVSLLMASGSPSNSTSMLNYNVSFAPAAPTGTIGVSANTGTYSGLATGINTITITDSVGCTATQTINVTGPPPIPSFSIQASNGTVIGCNPNYVPLNAVNTSTDPLNANMSYTWTSASTSSVGTGSINVGIPGTYTVSGQSFYTTPTGTVLTCITTTVISVTGSTVIPVTSVTGGAAGTTQSLTCNGPCKSFTATSTSTTNIIGQWYAPGGVGMGLTGTPMLLCANAPGTYTAEFCSTISGCCTQQTVAVVSNTQIPTLTVTPSTANGFTINCTNPKVIMSANTSATCGPVGYTWTPLASPASSVASGTGGYTVTVPGQYEIKFADCFSCTVTSTVNIFIDTLRPSPLSATNLPSNSYTLNCFHPCLIATGITNPLLPPTSYSWTTPGPLTLPSHTIQVCLADVTSSTTPVTYTVAAMGSNGCTGKAKVLFYKDIYIPPYVPVSTPSTGITCSNLCVAMSPFSSSTTTPISFTFTSPAPTQTATTSGALMCVPGTYTMNYINQVNGCGRTATTIVSQNVVQPAVNVSPVIYLPCGQTTTVISANTVTTSPTYSYTWEGPPGSAMSCVGGTACASPSVNMPGVYNVIIFNTMNGCFSSNSVSVVGGAVQAGFTANPDAGFSPLTVDFTNTSETGSAISGSVSTFWNFGNGLTYTTTGSAVSYSASGLPNASTIYQSAGTYTVTMVVTQFIGSVICAPDTASLVIKVDLPSRIEVPNVFTPNADGVNDNFILQTTNLTEIKCVIFDRWGVKMYDVTAERGNIEWDGKNLSKKDVPAGTYFYILTAKGKDLKNYEQKGTVSLYR